MRPTTDNAPSADHAELAAVIERLHTRMVAVATRVLRDDEEAHDAVQDAYLSAVRHLDRFDRRAELATWLHRVVVNASLMRLRARRRRPTEPLDPATLPADSMSMETILHRRRMQAAVRRSLADVRPDDRLVLTMRDIDGHETAQVARTLRVTPGAVKVRAFRARKALRARLVQLGVTSSPPRSHPHTDSTFGPEWNLQEVS